MEVVQEKGASLLAWPSLQLWGTKSNVKILQRVSSSSPAAHPRGGGCGGLGLGATVRKAEVILHRIRF